jgi:hypothetical protein
MDTYIPLQGDLAKALAAAQGEMSNPQFDSANPHFKNRFASLAAVRNAVIPVLARHGISCSQDLRTVENGVACVTVLTHESGQQQMFGPLVIPATKPDAQGFGSAATYARRYSLMAVAGVVGDDDDDANAASGKPAQAESIDPRGDLGKNVDTRLVNKWVKAVTESQDDATKLAGIWADLKGDHDLAIAVWNTISKGLKDKIRSVSQEAA